MSLELVCIQQQQCFVDMGIVGLSVDTQREYIEDMRRIDPGLQPVDIYCRYLQIAFYLLLCSRVALHTATPTTRLFTAEDFLLLFPYGPVNLLSPLRFNLHPPRLLLLFSSFRLPFPLWLIELPNLLASS